MSNAVHNNDIFSNLPKTDYLKLFEGNTSKNVVDFLDLNQADVAKATGIPKSSIRYGEDIPKELKNRLQEIAVICELVANYFEGDAKKTAIWFQLKNVGLGNVSPKDMIRFGRFKKLEKFIQNALAGLNP